MGLFGSRDDDPLLQDDPFAPSSSDPPSRDDEASTDPGRTSPQRHEEPEQASTRTIEYTQEEVTEGALDDLNQALVQDWRLTRIQMQEDGQFVFRLQRSTGPPGEENSII